MASREQLEELFARQRVKAHYVEGLAVAEVRFEAPGRSQARLGERLSAEAVEEYARAMAEGASFPPIVVEESRQGGYVVIDGHHRVAAALQAGREFLAAYIVTIRDATTRWVLRTGVNALEGMRTSPKERLLQAVQLVTLQKLTVPQAARVTGVAPGTITARLSYVRARSRLAELDFPVQDELVWNAGAVMILGAIPNDNVMSAAARVHQEAKLTQNDLFALSRSLKEKRTEGGQLALIEEYRDSDYVRARAARNSTVKHSTLPHRDRLFRQLAGVLTVLGDRGARELQINSVEDATRLAEMGREILARIARVCEEADREIAGAA